MPVRAVCRLPRSFIIMSPDSTRLSRLQATQSDIIPAVGARLLQGMRIEHFSGVLHVEFNFHKKKRSRSYRRCSKLLGTMRQPLSKKGSCKLSAT